MRVPKAIAIALVLGALAAPAGAQDIGARANAQFDRLLGDILASVQRPQLFHEWVSGHVDDIDQTLSVRRTSIKEVFVDLDGRPLINTEGGLIEDIVLDDYRYGADRFDLRIRDGTWRRQVRPGSSLAIGFIGEEGRRYYLFHGLVVRLESVPGRSGRQVFAVVGYHPTLEAGTKQRAFLNQRDSDVASQVASELGMMLNATVTQPMRSKIEQSESDLAFLYRLARRNNYDAFFDDGVFHFLRSEFSPPTPSLPLRSRSFVDMKDSDIVASIAGEHGFQSKVDDTGVHYAQTKQGNETDFGFLHRLAKRADREFWVGGGELYFVKRTVPAPADYRSYEVFLGSRYSDIAVTIAQTYGLRPDVEPSPEVHRQVEQEGLTDVEFLHRLARSIGYRMSIREGVLSFKRARTPYLDSDFIRRRVRILGVPATGYAVKFQERTNNPLEHPRNGDAVPLSELVVNLRSPEAPRQVFQAIPRGLAEETKEPPQWVTAGAALDSETYCRKIEKQLAAAVSTLARIEQKLGGDGDLSFKQTVATAFASSLGTRWCAEAEGATMLGEIESAVRELELAIQREIDLLPES